MANEKNKLESYMNEIGMSQADLVKKSGVSGSTVHKIFHNKEYGSAKNQGKIVTGIHKYCREADIPKSPTTKEIFPYGTNKQNKK